MTAREETPGYLHRLLALAPVLKRGVVTHVMVSHDEWCPALAGKGYCACVPDISLCGGDDARSSCRRRDEGGAAADAWRVPTDLRRAPR